MRVLPDDLRTVCGGKHVACINTLGSGGRRIASSEILRGEIRRRAIEKRAWLHHEPDYLVVRPSPARESRNRHGKRGRVRCDVCDLDDAVPSVCRRAGIAVAAACVELGCGSGLRELKVKRYDCATASVDGHRHRAELRNGENDLRGNRSRSQNELSLHCLPLCMLSVLHYFLKTVVTTVSRPVAMSRRANRQGPASSSSANAKKRGFPSAVKTSSRCPSSTPPGVMAENL